MTLPLRRLAAAAGAGRGREQGMTMIEVVMSATIMSTVMAVITTGLVQVYRVVNTRQQTSAARSEISTAYLRLEKEVRYASSVSEPSPPGTTEPYVEYLAVLPDPSTRVDTTMCVELRLHQTSDRLRPWQLQRRSWARPADALSEITPTAWHPLASGVQWTPETSAAPFTVHQPDDTLDRQRLELNLAIAADPGAAGNSQTASMKVLVTATNSSADTAQDSDICTGGRSV